MPNRYFPVEHHTAIPLLHFWDKGFELACKWLGKADWADERNLILMSWPSLAALTPGGASRSSATPASGSDRSAPTYFSASMPEASGSGSWPWTTGRGLWGLPLRASDRAAGTARRAIKSLRRKGSLLYEPGRRRVRRSFNLGAG